MSIEELVNTLAALLSELEGVSYNEALFMSRGVVKRNLILEIEWIDSILNK